MYLRVTAHRLLDLGLPRLNVVHEHLLQRLALQEVVIQRGVSNIHAYKLVVEHLLPLVLQLSLH